MATVRGGAGVRGVRGEMGLGRRLGAWLAPWEGQVAVKGGRVSLGQILLSQEDSADKKMSVGVGGTVSGGGWPPPGLWRDRLTFPKTCLDSLGRRADREGAASATPEPAATRGALPHLAWAPCAPFVALVSASWEENGCPFTPAGSRGRLVRSRR